MNKKQNLIIMITIIIIVLGFSISNYISKQKVYVLSNEEKKDTLEISNNTSNEEINTYEVNSEKIIIHIEGEVISPGVYELNKDTRVFDAIEAAGGLLETADRKKINLAKRIVDEEYIYIYSVNDETNEEFNNTNTVNTVSANDKNQALININKANTTELEMLPGIGQVLANRIIEYRTEKGGFKSIEDLRNVSGIGDKKFEDLKNKITVR